MANVQDCTPCVMFCAHSINVLECFYDLMSTRKVTCDPMETWNHKKTSDLKVTSAHYQKPYGPSASLNGTGNPWKIYDGCSQNLICDLNENGDQNGIDDQKGICLLNCLPCLTYDLCFCGHPSSGVCFHCSTCNRKHTSSLRI